MPESTAFEEMEIKRSAVRRWVTYIAIGTYLALSAITVGWLLYKEHYDMAIAVLGAVGSMAGSITGFWFGARRQMPATSNAATETRNGGEAE